MATKARVTAQDLWRMGEGDVRRELVNGEVVEMTPVGGIHGEITLRIGRSLAEHVEQHGGGKVLVGDVAFVSSDRLPGAKVPQGITWRPVRARSGLSPRRLRR